VTTLSERALVYLRVGVEAGGRHRAAGDALITAAVLRRLLDRARDRGVRTWRELELLAR
jgi:hypothetical protein